MKAQRAEDTIRWVLLKTDAEGDPAVVDRRRFAVQITGGPVALLGCVSEADDYAPIADRRGVPLQGVTSGIYYVDGPLHAVQPIASELATVTILLARA